MTNVKPTKQYSGLIVVPMDELIFYHGLTPEMLRGKCLHVEGQDYIEFSSFYKRVTRMHTGRRIIEFSPFPFDSESDEELKQHKSFTFHGYWKDYKDEDN